MAHSINLTGWHKYPEAPIYRGDNPFNSTLVTSVTKGAITWDFDVAVNSGTYVDGSPWIALDGKAVSLISTVPISSSGRNGGMVNPTSTEGNGMDDRMQIPLANANLYVHALNVTSSEKLPRLLSANESIMSCESKVSSSGDNPYLEEIQVLTVLASAPTANSFRPAYSGTTKTHHLESALDYAKIPTLAAPTDTTGMPTLAAAAAYFQGGPYIKRLSGFSDRYWHADVNHPGGAYGREIAKSTGESLMRVMLQGSSVDKRDLVVGLVQAGIDIYGASQSGLNWNADGGHNQGAKMLVMFAGKVLNNAAMLAVANWGTTDIFQEDQQSFYIHQDDVDITNSVNWDPDTRNPSPLEYEVADITRQDWGLRRYLEPERSDMSWASYYRNESGCGQFSHCVAAFLMDVQTEWNNSAWFDYYINRYYIVESGNDASTAAEEGIGTGTNAITNFASNVYLTHINTDPTDTQNAPSSIVGVQVGKIVIETGNNPR